MTPDRLHPLARLVPLAALLVAGCVVQSSRPPVEGGDGVTVDGKTQTVAIDPAKVPIQDKSCQVGQVLRRTAGGWECASIPVVSPDHIPSVDACQPGQVVSRTASGWTCVDPLDPTRTPVVSPCAAGEFVQKTSDGWTCALAVDANLTPVLDDCPLGQVVTMGANGWTCAPAIDVAHTPTVSVCATGQVVTKTDTGWTCAPAIDPVHTPTVGSCAAGQVVTMTASGWQCQAPAGPDPAKTPVIPTCAAGQYVQRTASGWQCTNLVGDLTGNVKGNLTGNVTGNLTGTVAGNVTGNLTGDVTGNLQGDSFGLHHGPVAGDVTGNLSGNVTGNVTGNLNGNVNGNLTGNVTGNVSGTAANVTGVVAVANGGTGVTSFPANALVAMGSGTLTGIGPGATGSLLGTTAGGAWAPVAPPDLGLVQRTTATLTLYVRKNGDDACSGLVDADAPGSGTKKDCALATPQAALDRVPDVMNHPVVIQFGPGTWYGPAGGVLLDIAKLARSSASLTLRGSTGGSPTVFSGASASAPTTVSGLRGLVTATPILNLVLSNLTFDRFYEGVRLVSSSASVDNVTVTNCSSTGLAVDRGSFVNVLTGLTLTGNGGIGLDVSYGSRFYLAGTGTGPSLVAATLASTGNTTNISVSFASAFGTSYPTNTITATGAASTAVSVTSGASFLSAGTLAVSSTGGYGLYTGDRSTTSLSGTVTINVSAAGAQALTTWWGSYASVANATVNLTCGSNSSTVGIGSANMGITTFGGTTPVTVSGCAYSEWTVNHAMFVDSSTGTKTAPGPIVANLSFYAKGGFPAANAAVCTNGSVCP